MGSKCLCKGCAATCTVDGRLVVPEMLRDDRHRIRR
jgi:hypothetical protein